MIRTLGVVSLCLASAVGRVAGQSGCTDPQALNYDPLAIVNDGTCAYPPTLLPVRRGALLAPILEETSGLAYFNDHFWTFNDSGGEPALYAIDTVSGAVLHTFRLAGATNTDWEAICTDGAYVYVGDVGNNATGARQDLTIYRIPLSAIPANRSDSILIDDGHRIRFKYATQTDTLPSAPNQTEFDCEAFVALNDTLHLFSKNWASGNQTVRFTLPATPGLHLAQPRDTFPTGFLVTGASLRTGPQQALCLIGYSFANMGVTSLWLFYQFSGDHFFSANKRLLGLGSALSLGQMEAVWLSPKNELLLSNERFRLGTLVDVAAGLWHADLTPFLEQGQTNALPTRPIEDFYWRYDAAAASISIGSTRPLPVPVEATLFDMSGQALLKTSGLLSKAETLALDLATLPSGVYVMVLRSGGKQQSAQILKQ